VAAGLRGRFRVLAIDARGHGDSSKPESPEAYAWHHFVEDLECVGRRLADDEGGGRIGLGIGHSFGGAALLTAAAHCPDLFESLLLLDPVLIGELPRPHVPKGIDPGVHLAERTRRRRAVWPSRAEALEAWENHAFYVAWTPEARQLFARWGLRDRPDGQVELKCPPAAEAAVFENGGTLFPLDEVHRIRVPTLFVHADRGTFALDTYRLLAERMPGGRVESHGLGHLMVMEDPQAVVEIALSFADADQDSTG
jgi:pimeloyl-ACP methyl ester carboxylesterase